jgi:hypothetical protein
MNLERKGIDPHEFVKRKKSHHLTAREGKRKRTKKRKEEEPPSPPPVSLTISLLVLSFFLEKRSGQSFQTTN